MNFTNAMQYVLLKSMSKMKEADREDVKQKGGISNKNIITLTKGFVSRMQNEQTSLLGLV